MKKCVDYSLLVVIVQNITWILVSSPELFTLWKKEDLTRFGLIHCG